MSGNGFDPYDCICYQVAIVRRLLGVLQNQNNCDAVQCHPRVPHVGDVRDLSSGLPNLYQILMTLAIVFVVAALFLARPKSQRPSDRKGTANRDNESGGPPPADALQ